MKVLCPSYSLYHPVKFQSAPSGCKNSPAKNNVSKPDYSYSPIDKRFLLTKFNISFEGKKRADEKPEYSDIESFPVYLEKKIKRMLSKDKITDTKSAIKSSLDIEAIDAQFKQDEIGFIYSACVSLGNAISYLATKKQITLIPNPQNRGAFIVDDFSVEQLKKLGENDIWLQNLLFYTDSGKVKFYSLSDEEETKRLEQETKEKLGREIQITRIIPPEEYALKYPNADIIRSTVKAAGEYKFPNDKDKQTEFAKMMFKYLDEFLFPVSYAKITEGVKKQYKKISALATKQGKTMDDVVYLTPYVNKSYDLISYIYAATNNVSPDKFVILRDDMKIDPNKIYVVIDDLSLSGESAETTITRFEGIVGRNGFTKARFKNNIDFIFSPIISVKHSEDIIRSVRKDVKAESPINVHYFPVFRCRELTSVGENSSFTEDEIDYLKDNLATGYGEIYTCISLPYMIPDNSSDIGAIIARNFLTEKCPLNLPYNIDFD